MRIRAAAPVNVLHRSDYHRSEQPNSLEVTPL